MSYSIKINGTNYEASTKEAYEALYKANGNSKEVQQVLQTYSKQITKTKEDELVVLDNSIDQDAADYQKAVGLSSLSEECSVDDIEDIYNNIEDEIDNLDSLMSGLDYSNPEEVNDALDKAQGLFQAVSTLAQVLGADIANVQMASAKANKVGEIATTGIAVGAGVAIASSVAASAVSAGIATGAIATAASASWIPVAGWIVAGVSLVVAGIAGIVGHNQQKKAEEKLEKMKNGIQDKAEEVAELTTKAMEKYKEETENGIVQELTEDIGDLMSGAYKFNDPTDIYEVMDNYERIENSYSKLNPHLQLCEKYGISVSGIDDLYTLIGSEEAMKAFMQTHLEEYVVELSNHISADDTVIKDTESLNAFYAQLEILAKTSNDKGLDPTNLHNLMFAMNSLNQQEVENDIVELEEYQITMPGAGSGTSEYVSQAGNAWEAAGIADTDAAGVQQGATSYDVATDGLSTLAENKRVEAQESVNSYLTETTTDGLTIEELETLHGEVVANEEAFGSITSELDLSGFPTKLDEIRAAQQAIVDNYAAEITTQGKTIEELEELYNQVVAKQEEFAAVTSEVDLAKLVEKCAEARTEQQNVVNIYVEESQGKINSSSETEERKGYITETNAYISQYSGYEVDLSGVEGLLPLISQKEEEAIAIRAQGYNANCEACQQSQEAYPIIETVNMDITNVSGMNCDISELTNAINSLNLKLEELLAKEAYEAEQERLKELELQQAENEKEAGEEDENTDNTNSGEQEDENGIIVTPGGVIYENQEDENANPDVNVTVNADEVIDLTGSSESTEEDIEENTETGNDFTSSENVDTSNSKENQNIANETNTENVKEATNNENIKIDTTTVTDDTITEITPVKDEVTAETSSTETVVSNDSNLTANAEVDNQANTTNETMDKQTTTDNAAAEENSVTQETIIDNTTTEQNLITEEVVADDVATEAPIEEPTEVAADGVKIEAPIEEPTEVATAEEEIQEEIIISEATEEIENDEEIEISTTELDEDLEEEV